MALGRFIESYAGGSLNTVIAQDGQIIKSYDGLIPRGAEKLIREYQWLKNIPTELLSKYPYLFPRPISIYSNISLNKAEIRISKIPRISLSKYILGKRLSLEQVSQSFDSSMEALLRILYPLRSGSTKTFDGYYEYHAKRIALARKYLRRLPYFEPMLNAKELIINGISCPTINQFLAWLDDNFGKIFISTKLVAVHGNFHFDNILIEPNDIIDMGSVSFIDPRGDEVGFPHYDFAKVLTPIESYYDEIHYGLFRLDYSILGNSYSMQIEIDDEYNTLYQSCFLSLEKWIQEFSYAEEVDRFHFLAMTHTVHCIHILSFTFYHAYQQSSSPDRIRAYIAMLALLAKRLFKLYETNSFDFVPSNRLLKGDTYGIK